MRRFSDLWGLWGWLLDPLGHLLDQFPAWHVVAIGLMVFIGCGCDGDWGIKFHQGDNENPPEQVLHEGRELQEDGPEQEGRFEPRRIEPQRREVIPQRFEPQHFEPQHFEPQHFEPAREFPAPREPHPWGTPATPPIPPAAQEQDAQPIEIQTAQQPARQSESLPEAKRGRGRGRTGATIFCPVESEEADWLIADIRTRARGWTVGDDEENHFQVVRRPQGTGLVVVYFLDGRETGRIEHYHHGDLNELNAILGKHPSYRGVPNAPSVGASITTEPVCTPHHICVWNDQTGRWECH
jgi:hypothetical protein